jgi:hypothetical protein
MGGGADFQTHEFNCLCPECQDRRKRLDDEWILNGGGEAPYKRYARRLDGTDTIQGPPS